MAHPDYLKEKARKLRRERQLTLDELVTRLALPRTTIYYWVADIPIPITARQSANQRLGTKAMQRKYRLLREGAYMQGRAEFAGLASDVAFRDFVCLYIAEGYKRSRNRVSLANSDAAVIRLADRWIRCFTRKRVWYSVQHHVDQDPEVLKQFWGLQLTVDPSSITVLRKSNSGELTGRQWRCEHGVLTVGANDTLLRARLGAWMDCLREHWLELDSHGRGA